ncbi:hypothetical protein N0B31_11940 [Salinirubellus salinus]|uniref:ArsR family transcriptional regulator n=1 Tax=Salinirubellus salinus TaxID=1364945 RepID=A0A9E7QZF1_9EURY|nr:hypothetical protein [Salinirubellus salinus]UWM52859.1 hypothetical protein N0B31_11940 [Salinirubellus salinus]
MSTPEQDALSADEAFALVGHEIRVAILRAVMDAAKESGDPYAPVSFSELRDRVGTRDSGQFNYHLGKLVGPFLDHDEAGYRMRYTTLLVVGAILAGTYTERGDADPVAVDTPCPVCGGLVEATYVAERGEVACTECGEVFCSAAVPPGALEGYDPAEYPEVFLRWTGRLMGEMRSGFCLACTGPVSPRVAVAAPGEEGNARGETPGVVVHYECERCPERAFTSLGAALFDHPAVVAFHWDHGVDTRDPTTLGLAWLYDDHAHVVSEVPLRVECRVELDGETLTLTLDDGLDVLEVTGS